MMSLCVWNLCLNLSLCLFFNFLPPMAVAGHECSAVVAPTHSGHSQHSSAGMLPGCSTDSQIKGQWGFELL